MKKFELKKFTNINQELEQCKYYEFDEPGDIVNWILEENIKDEFINFIAKGKNKWIVYCDRKIIK